MDNNIMVSVICIAYNHEKYISKALDSMVKQKTNFQFEIIVHDDASTDATPTIIKEYAEQYANIVTVLQKENKYSQKENIMTKYVLPLVRGKYIAYCEGDDYWTDNNKLQKQFEALETNLEVNMCAHSSYKVQNDQVIGIVKRSDVFKILTPEQVILGGGSYLMTNSLFYRKEIAVNIPEFRKVLDFDYSTQIHGALNGGIAYYPETMSAYRVFSNENAWTSIMAKNRKVRIDHHRKVLAMLETLDMETNYRYDRVIKEKSDQIEFDILWLSGNYKAMISKAYREQFLKCSKKKKLTILVGVISPRLSEYLFK